MKPSRAWVLVRRPLLLTFVLGFAISLIAAGRFSVRLIVDGSLSFAFVPLSELAGFAVVYRLTRAPLSFTQAVDRFFAGNTPWLWWLIGIMTATTLLPVIRHGNLLAPLPRGGKAYGDPDLIRLAAADGRLPAAARPDYAASWLDRVSQLLGLAGLAGLVVYSARRPDRSRAA